MTTVASIIKSALRETNLIPLGVEPTAAQLAEGFDLLSVITSSVVGNEMGDPIDPFPLGQHDINSPSGYPWWSNSLPSNIFVPTNMRIMCNLTGPGTINLHPRPHDGARMGIVDVSGNFATYPLTINGNGRSIEGASTQTYNTNGQTREWVYREDLGNWVVVTPLDVDGDMPFASEFDDMFIIMLAMRINPRNGQVMHPASLKVLQDSTSRFSARYSQSTTVVSVEDALLYTTNYNRFYGRRGTEGWGNPTGFFNSGWPY